MKPSFTRFAVLLWIFLFAAGCIPLVPLPVTTGPTSMPVPEETATPSQTLTPTLPSQCAYVWSEQALPELSEEVNQAFQTSGMQDVDVRASAYGESCIDPGTNQAAGFLPMQTDFHILVGLDAMDNPELMGEWVEQIMRALEAYQPGTIPGPNPGYVGITFANAAEKITLWFPRTRAVELIKQGTRGSSLFEALRSP